MGLVDDPPPGVRLAVVGSTCLTSERARQTVRAVIVRYRPAVVVSGGADGIDTLAAQEATRLSVTFVEFPGCRKNHRHVFGTCFAPRNRRIAEFCTHLVRVVGACSRTYGSGWTRDRALELGKPVEEIRLEE